MTRVDEVMMLSGSMLALPLFILSRLEEDTWIDWQRYRFILFLGETFWFVWLMVCGLIFAGTLIFKLIHKVFP